MVVGMPRLHKWDISRSKRQVLCKRDIRLEYGSDKIAKR